MQPVHLPVSGKKLIHKLKKRNFFSLSLIDALTRWKISNHLGILVVLGFEVCDCVADLIVRTAFKRRQPTVVDEVEFLTEWHVGVFVQALRRKILVVSDLAD